MTQHQSYDELEIDRPRICGGAVFLKLMKSGRCGSSSHSLQKIQKKNEIPVLTSSSSSSSSSISRWISDGSARSLSTTSNINNMYDPLKTWYCMPRQIVGTGTKSSEYNDSCKLDFKLHEEVNSDMFFTKEDPNDLSPEIKVEKSELQLEEHVSSQNIIRFDPHLVNNLRTEHLQSIGDNIYCAEKQLRAEHEDISMACLQDHSEEQLPVLSEITPPELEQADDVDENKDVDAAWGALQRVTIAQKSCRDGEKTNYIDGLEQNQGPYDSKAVVGKNETISFRQELDDVKESLLQYELNPNPWPDEDDPWDKIDLFSMKDQSQDDDNCAQKYFKSEWNLNFNNPDNDNKIERSEIAGTRKTLTENEMKTEICHENVNYCTIYQDSDKHERNCMASSEPILSEDRRGKMCNQIESEYDSNYVTVSVDSKILKSENAANVWLKSATSPPSKIESEILENRIMMKSTDSKAEGNQNIHQPKTNISTSCSNLAQKEGTHSSENQQVSHTMPDMMNENACNNYVSSESDYHEDMKVVRKLLKKYGESYEEPCLKKSMHRKGSSTSIHRENPFCSEGLENPYDEEFHRHADLATQVTNKNKSHKKTQLAGKLNAERRSNLLQQKDHIVGTSLQEKSNFSGRIPSTKTNQVHFKNPITDEFTTTTKRHVQTVGKLSSDKIKFWNT